MDDTYVIYHGGCHDGFGAAWVARKALGPDTIFIPAKHGSTPPRIPSDSLVYIFDFAYDRDTLIQLADHTELVVLDHHRSAQQALADLEFATFDMDRSGAMLAWDYFFEGNEAPDLLKWIQDRDLWRWEYPESAPATAALQAYPFDFDVWDRLMDYPEELLTSGRVALALSKEQVARTCDNVYMGSMCGHMIPIVNATGYWSEIGNELCKRFPDAPFSASWYVRSNGTKKWALRSVGEFDVSEIAKGYGGGGHKNAAGFVAPG